MSFYRAFYHLIWSTKYRSNLLTSEVETFAYEVMRSKAIQLGATIFALNGIENHVHLVATIPPSISVCEVVKQVKGITSFRLNQLGNRAIPFAWQSEFGMFTFDEKRLPNYIRYVEQQKEHHAQNQLIPILEQIKATSLSTIRDTPLHYLVDDKAWWVEMCSLES